MNSRAGGRFQYRKPSSAPASATSSSTSADPSAPGQQGGQEERRDQGHARRQPVHVVEQVQRVADAGEPERGDQRVAGRQRTFRLAAGERKHQERADGQRRDQLGQSATAAAGRPARRRRTSRARRGAPAPRPPARPAAPVAGRRRGSRRRWQRQWPRRPWSASARYASDPGAAARRRRWRAPCAAPRRRAPPRWRSRSRKSGTGALMDRTSRSASGRAAVAAGRSRPGHRYVSKSSSRDAPRSGGASRARGQHGPTVVQDVTSCGGRVAVSRSTNGPRPRIPSQIVSSPGDSPGRSCCSVSSLSR